ncbi:MAG: hypothetical protein HY751_09090 [Nitrospinae bacterium]|nr:hypothetical protein [Nitrospinota bacterium]
MKLTPNMMVENVNSTLEYYTAQLGFELVMAVPQDSREVLFEFNRERPLVYAMVKKDGAELMFQTRESLMEDVPAFTGQSIGSSVTFYMETDDLDGIFQKLGPSVDVVKKPETTWYGMREFYIRDLNGYILGFGQRA